MGDASLLELRAFDQPPQALIEGHRRELGVAVKAGEPQAGQGVALQLDNKPVADALALALGIDRHLHQLAPFAILALGGRQQQGTPDHPVAARQWMGGDEVDEAIFDAGVLADEPGVVVTDGVEQDTLAQGHLLRIERMLSGDALHADHGEDGTCSPVPVQAEWVCMTRRAELRDPTVLLCERCGYDLTGTPMQMSCAECGRAIRDSLPERRPGTPWQQGPGPVSFVRTVWMIARHPRAVWEVVRIERWDSAVFGAICMVIASAIMWVGVSFTSIAVDLRSGLGAMLLIGLGTLFMMILEKIEVIGLIIIGRKNGWRVTREISQAVCGHASVGWIVAGVLVGIGWQLGTRLPAAPLVNSTPSWMNPIVTSLQFVLPGIGFFIGMMVFETLAYLGVRRMRWANG